MEIAGCVLFAQGNVDQLPESRAAYLAALDGRGRKRSGGNRRKTRVGSVRNPRELSSINVNRLVDSTTTLRADKVDGCPNIRPLANDEHLKTVVSSVAVMVAMIRVDNVSSPNVSPTRHEIVYSQPGKWDAMVDFQPVKTLPMRQTIEPSTADYQTVDVHSLPNRPLTLSDLRLEFGVSVAVNRHPFAVQLEACIHAIEMAVSMQIDLPVDCRQYAGLR